MSKSTLFRGSIWFFMLLSAGCAGKGSGKNGNIGKSYSAQIGVSYRAEFFGSRNIFSLTNITTR